MMGAMEVHQLVAKGVEEVELEALEEIIMVPLPEVEEMVFLMI
jgi:hypothetical protein